MFLGNVFEMKVLSYSDSDVEVEKVVAAENNEDNLKEAHKSIEVKKEMLKGAKEKLRKQ